MKTLKITFLLAAVLLLTVSVVSTDLVNQNEDTTIKAPAKVDLLAHKKKLLKLPENG